MDELHPKQEVEVTPEGLPPDFFKKTQCIIQDLYKALGIAPEKGGTTGTSSLQHLISIVPKGPEQELLVGIRNDILSLKDFSIKAKTSAAPLAGTLLQGALEQLSVDLCKLEELRAVQPQIEAAKQAYDKKPGLSEDARKYLQDAYKKMQENEYTDRLPPRPGQGPNFGYKSSHSDENARLADIIGPYILCGPGGRFREEYLPEEPVPFFTTSIGMPLPGGGRRPLVEGKGELQNIPLIQSPQQSGHFRIRYKCDEVACIPCPLEYEVVALTCDDQQGNGILSEKVHFFIDALGQYQVKCPGMKEITVEITSDQGAKGEKIKAILAETPKPPADLHPYLLDLFKDKGQKFQFWPEEEALGNANRLLEKIGATICADHFYDADILGKTLVKVAADKGMLDLVMAYFPVADCGFYANFYARISNAMGIPSCEITGHNTFLEDLADDFNRSRSIVKIPHAKVVSLLPDSTLCYSDPTSANILNYRDNKGEIKPAYKAIFDEVIARVAAGNFSTTADIDQLVDFFKQKFSELKNIQRDSIPYKNLGDRWQKMLAKADDVHYIYGLLEMEFSKEVKKHTLKNQSDFLNWALSAYTHGLVNRLPWGDLKKNILGEMSRLENGLKELIKKVEAHYGISLTLPMPFSDLSTEQKKKFSSGLDQIISYSTFFERWCYIPFPDPQTSNIGNLIFKVLGMDEQIHQVISRLMITKDDWSDPYWREQQTKPSYRSADGQSLFSTVRMLGIAHKIISSDNKVLGISDPGNVIEKINQTFFTELLSFPQHPEFNDFKEAWTSSTREISKDTKYAFYLKRLFPENTTDRFQLFLLLEKMQYLGLSDDIFSKNESLYKNKTNELIKQSNFSDETKDFLSLVISDLISAEIETAKRAELPFYGFAAASDIAGKMSVFLSQAGSYLDAVDCYPFHNSAVGDPLNNMYKKEFRALIKPYLEAVTQLPLIQTPKAVLQKLVQEKFVGDPKNKSHISGGYDVESYQEATKGRILAHKESIHPVYLDIYNQLTARMHSVQFPLAAGDSQISGLLQIMKGIPDFNETGPGEKIQQLLKDKKPIGQEAVAAVLAYLDRAMQVPVFKEPIFEEEIPQPEKTCILVDLHDLALHPEKVSTLFSFIDLKQKVDIKQKNTLQISLYWREQPIETIDLKNRSLEKEIETFFNLQNSRWEADGVMPNSFVHHFFEHMSKVIPRTRTLKNAQALPHPENNYLIPQDGYPKDANQFILFADTANFRGFAAELGKKGKAFVFA